MKLIGLVGAAGAGKDTAASYLVERGWVRIAFADKLKAMAYDINPWISRPKSVGGFVRLHHLVDSIGWDVAKTSFPEVRKFLQDLGVAARKHIAEDVWVDAAIGIMDGHNVVVTDVRFKNELAAVKAWGGELVLIERPVGAADLGANAGHISETDWLDAEFDYTLINDDTADFLGWQIVQIADGDAGDAA